MTLFRKIKNEKEFLAFVKKFQKRREELKHTLLTKKLGDSELTETVEKIQKPVVRALTESSENSKSVSQLQTKPHVQAIKSSTQPETIRSRSQGVIQEFMSKPTSQKTTSTLEVNLGNGKIGKFGKINVTKLINDDIIEFTDDKLTEIIPTTLGLLYLLLAPYKFISIRKLLNGTITEADKILYAQIIHRSGVDDTVKGTSEKYAKIVRPTLQNQELLGRGINQKTRNAYKLDLNTGAFGKLNINVPMLMAMLTLQVHHGRKKIIDQRVDPDLIYLLTKRYNPKKHYSPQSIETFTKLVEKSGLKPAVHTGKLKLLQGGGAVSGCSKQYFSSIDELVNRLSLLLASVEAGNTSIDVKNEISEILDILLRNKCLNKQQHYQLYKTYVK